MAGLANQIHDNENDKANYHPLVHVILGTVDWEIFMLKIIFFHCIKFSSIKIIECVKNGDIQRSLVKERRATVILWDQGQY